MKKIKIILLSLALFAVVGAALAFKARFHTAFCTTEAVYNGGGNYTCPVLCPNPAFSTISTADVPVVCVGSPYNFDETTVTCTALIVEDITTAPCIGFTKLTFDF